MPPPSSDGAAPTVRRAYRTTAADAIVGCSPPSASESRVFVANGHGASEAGGLGMVAGFRETRDMTRRVTSSAIRARKGASFPVITAYDAPFARIAEAAGVDVLLVGDSLGMVVLGYDSTMPVTLDDMLRHGGAVVRGTSKAHVMIDLPFGSYQASDERAIASAVAAARVGATSVKMEVSLAQMSRVRAVVDAGIPVCAHIGVLPQVAAMTSGFRKQSAHDELLATAKAAEAAGAFVLVMEMVDAEVAEAITRAVAIPTIGIGSGVQCDAQVLVMHDVLGLYGSPPPFSRTFADVADVATRGIADYARAVRDRTFPPKGAMTNDEASHIYGAADRPASVEPPASTRT